MDNTYINKRIESIHNTELTLISFLNNYSQLINKIEKLNNGESHDNDTKEITSIIDQCYKDLSNSSISLRKELKLLELNLPLPYNLNKKSSNTNNNKLNTLLN